MIKVTIDGNTYEAQPGQMLIEVTDAAGIEIPRFCYHKKLSVAANCRMCLVDVEKAPKPLPACATPVMDGMVVQTRSAKAKNAQKSVMEFLLINHPLDCPICDQGGECELQDVAMGYGQDTSRFMELKRVISDKDLGPLIATEMTRCIHCTRCVRFGTEIAGIREMGATGRGEHTRIGTYIENSVDSELSGNMIDVCPVGALTAKPFRFNGRAWEMQQYSGIAPHDGVGSNIYMHARRNQVLRVVSKENQAINEVWIADRDRFSYEALKSDKRLLHPIVKRDGQWQQTDWETALNYAMQGLRNTIEKHGADAIGGLASPTATLEELYLLQKLLRGLGSPNIDHRLHQIDFSDQEQAPLYPFLGQSIEELEKTDSALLIGTHLRKEQPLLNHRLRKAALRNIGLIHEQVVADIMVINPIDYEFNLPIAEKIITVPSQFINELAGIAKALLELKVDLAPKDATKLLAKTSTNETQQSIAKKLSKGHHATILVGHLSAMHPEFAKIRMLSAWIAQMSQAKLGYLAEAGNSVGAALVGALPHKEIANKAAQTKGKTAFEMLSPEQSLKAYILLGLEPELDSCMGNNAKLALDKANFVVACSAYQNSAQQDYADVILPIALFPETSGSYVNCEGTWQTTNGVVSPPAEVRPAWKVLRVLGNLLSLNGFSYTSTAQIKEEITSHISATIHVDNLTAWQMPDSLDAHTAPDNQLERITEIPMYASDVMLRNATALQKTHDANISKHIYVNPEQLQRLKLENGSTVQVKQGDLETQSSVFADARVPIGCALYYAGQATGAWHGYLTLKSA